MVTGVIFLIAFLGGLFFFGWQIARFILKTNRLELLLPVSLAIGYGVYTFFLNIFSYLIPIELNFYLIFIVLLIIALILFFLNKEKLGLEWGLSKKESLIIFTTVFLIMILSGFLASRNIGGDDLAYPHLPAIVSMVGGNFPVKNLNLPEENLVINYGPYLFYAAISKITGFSVFSSFCLSVLLFNGVIFLLILNLAKLFVANNWHSFLVALVGMFGGGFRFIYGFKGLIDLYQKFFLHWNIEHPFKFFGYMWSTSPLTGSLIGNIFRSWSNSALGYSLIVMIIYLYLGNFISSKRRSYYYDFLMIILLSVLALNSQMGFLCLCFGILVVPFIIYFKDKNKDDFKLLLKRSLLILAIASILALLQGGVITDMLKNIMQHRASYGFDLGFSIFKHPFSFDLDNGVPPPFYGLMFVLNFGLAYFLIIPAIIFIIKKHFEKGVFLTVISGFSFFIPFAVSFSWVWQGTMDLFFRFSSLIWAILVGLFLVTALSPLKERKFLKIIIYLCLVIICLEGCLFLLTRPWYRKDDFRLDNDSFFGKLIPPTEIESRAYQWAEENSTSKDYFLVFADKKNINNQSTVLENFRFVMFTKRLAPVYIYSNNSFNPALPPHPYYTPAYQRLISNCNKSDMQLLNYQYLFIDNNWPKGLAEKCLANNNLELKFDSQSGEEFARIYKVIY